MLRPLLLLVAITASLIAADPLPYSAREAVRRQTSNVQKAEQQLADLTKQAEAPTYARKVEPGLGIAPLLDSIEKDLTTNKAPADHPTVADLLARVKAVRDALPALEKTLGEKSAQSAAQGDTKNYPHYALDLEKLDSFWKKYKVAAEHAGRVSTEVPKQRGDLPSFSQPMAGMKDFVQAALSYKEDATYFNAAMKRNEPLMKVNADAQAKLSARAKTAFKYMNEFHAVRDKAVEAFPVHIRHNLGVATQMADKAVAERKPMFFQGGVKQAMTAASEQLEAYRAVKGDTDESTKTLIAEHTAVKAKIDAAELALAETVLAEARPPKAAYTGSDKADLTALVRKTHAERFPKEEILDVRLVSEAWKRETAWRSNATEWYKVDDSHLLAVVIVKINDQVAVAWPAYINKNHLESDRITVGAKAAAYSETKFLVANLGK